MVQQVCDLKRMKRMTAFVINIDLVTIFVDLSSPQKKRNKKKRDINSASTLGISRIGDPHTVDLRGL